MKEVERSTARTFFYILLLTVLFEAVTLVFRFGFDIEATRDTKSFLAPLTGNVRIHHCYIGLLMLPIAALLRRTRPTLARRLLEIGVALFLSDMLHHFVVLFLANGTPEFDLIYK